MELIKNLKEVSLVKNLFLAVLGTIVLAISAKVKIPFYPVPMTMQTFVVLLLGVSFGWRLGLFTITLYLIEGIAGLPVFAGTPEKGVGIVYFINVTHFYYFLKKLKDTKEGAANMLDNTLVLYGSTTSKLHYGRNYPLILAGGKGMGYKHGQYHKFDEEKYRMSDLMVTMQNSLGMKAETFGDSTKNLNDVFWG